MVHCTMKVIKRYANRRLYDPDTSRTITLEEVAKIIRSGEDIKVIDNITQEDITSKILGQTFLKLSEPQSSQNPSVQNYLLKMLIRESKGGLIDLLKKFLLVGVGMTQTTPEERKTLFEGIVNSGSPELTGDWLKDMAERGQKEADKMLETITSLVQGVTQSIQSNVATALDPFERSKKMELFMKQMEDLQKNLFSHGKDKNNSDQNRENKKEKEPQKVSA